MKKITLTLITLILISGCNQEINIELGGEVNQLCTTDIGRGYDSGGPAEQYWDLSNVSKDCRKGEIITTTVWYSTKIASGDVQNYEYRIAYLISKICDFDKQIIMHKIDIHNSRELPVYDLTCVYSGGHQLMTNKWVQELEDNATDGPAPFE